MTIENYGFGVCFSRKKFAGTNCIESAYKLLFSILTADDLLSMDISEAVISDKPDCFLIVFESDSFKQARNVCRILQSNEFLTLFTDDDTPYIDRNRLLDIKTSKLIGSVDQNTGKIDSSLFLYKHTGPYFYGDKQNRIGEGKRFLFAPDSFKGSLSAVDCVRLLTIASCSTPLRGAEIIPIPVADGGEGTIASVINSINGLYRTVAVHDPLGREIDASYCAFNDGHSALIEMAAASGLTLVAENERDIMRSSSYGTGELILDAVQKGCRDIIVAVGGSATNDGGMGCAKALGVKFFDKHGNELHGRACDMISVRKIDLSEVPQEVLDARITVMSDVKNTFTGIRGATMTYSEQKGATPIQMFRLECGMKTLRRFYSAEIKRDISRIEGTGAAGGISGMFLALFNAKIVSGIDAVLNMTEFDSAVKSASVVITGEGKIDSTTFNGGKVVSGVMRRSGKTPVVLIAGSIDKSANSFIKNNISVQLKKAHMTDEYAIENAKTLFYESAVNMFEMLALGIKIK